MSNTHNIIKELITFYIKSNYDEYLKQNNIDKMPTDSIESIVEKLFDIGKSLLEGIGSLFRGKGSEAATTTA